MYLPMDILTMTVTLLWTWIYNLPLCHCQDHPEPELEQFLDPAVSLALDFHDGSTLMQQLPRLPVASDRPNANLQDQLHWSHVQVFRINRPTQHCFILWEVYERILADIAGVLRITKQHDIVEIHDVKPHAKVHGVGSDTAVVILQQAGDLPLTDPRVLVLWEVHFHQAAELFVGPTVKQEVLRTHTRISRQGIWKQAQTPVCEKVTLSTSPKCIVLPNDVPIHVGKYTIVSWILWHGYLNGVISPYLKQS